MTRPTFIETFTGRRFDPFNAKPDDVVLEDIAHPLSHQCRFSGHTRAHYSVAEHSVRVAELVESWDMPRGFVLWALLHDASEAYLVDLPSPLKGDPVFGARYLEVEAHLMGVIAARFGLRGEMPSIAKVADLVLLATEARDLMPHRPEHWAGQLPYGPLPETITPWSHETAKKNFIATFGRITT